MLKKLGPYARPYSKWIAEMHIWIRHIEFCAKNHAAFY